MKDNLSRSDQKALFIARFFAGLVMFISLSTLLVIAIYFRELNDQDKRTEYIESGHSEIR
jgi:hypothetical protein